MKTTALAITAVMALAHAAYGDGIYGDQNAFGNGTANSYYTGADNTGYGDYAFGSLTSGNYNTALGQAALTSLTTGSDNAALGNAALAMLANGNNNTAIGGAALLNSTSGNFNIALGYNAGISLGTGDNNIDIGNQGDDESGTIRIGTPGIHTNTFIAGISGVTVSGGSLVAVNANGQLGTVPAGYVLLLPTNSVAPTGYTLLGTTEMKCKYQVGSKHKSATMTFDLYQKN